jgi:hypothetical protein
VYASRADRSQSSHRHRPSRPVGMGKLRPIEGTGCGIETAVRAPSRLRRGRAEPFASVDGAHDYNAPSTCQAVLPVDDPRATDTRLQMIERMMRAKLRCRELSFSFALAAMLSSTTSWTDAGDPAGPAHTTTAADPAAFEMQSMSWL